MANPYYNRQTDFIPDTPVRSDDMDQELDAVVAGFDLLADPSRINTGSNIYGVDSGTADNYVVDNGGGPVLVDGQMTSFTPDEGNTGAAVMALNGGSNKTIVRNDGSALQGDDLIQDVPVAMIYDLANDQWVLIGSTARQSSEGARPAVTVDGSGARTISGIDETAVISFTSSTPVTVTCPADASDDLPVGFITHCHQDGSGQISIAPEVGVSLRYATSLRTRTVFSSLSLIKMDANVWKIIGDMEPT